MNYRRAAMIGILLFAGMAQSQASDSLAQSRPYFSSLTASGRVLTPRLSANYLYCLQSTNYGVVESSLGHLAHLKLQRPEENVDCMKSEIDKLALFGPTPQIRYKAYLASLVFDSPGIFARVSIPECSDCDQFFQALSGALHGVLEADKGRKFVMAE